MLESDYNWWQVRILDNDMHEELYDEDFIFDFENREWSWREIIVLLEMVGVYSLN